jgi:Uracil DNA glycosylase superfamily
VAAARGGRPLGALVDELAAARIGSTFNQYRGSRLRRDRLEAYLESRRDARIVLVGEAAGYRGARISGIPFTSERQLTGTGPAEATATVVHRVLRELGLEEEVLLWNVVPTHPGTAASNRPPTRAEVVASLPFLEELAAGRRAIAVGRLAERVLRGPYVRHPAHGGAAAFRAGLVAAAVPAARQEEGERERREDGEWDEAETCHPQVLRPPPPAGFHRRHGDCC